MASPPVESLLAWRPVTLQQQILTVAAVVVCTVFIALYVLASNKRHRMFKKAAEYKPSAPSVWAGKELLVVVNPVGGNRRGFETCMRVIKPMLEKGGAIITVQKTNSATHAYDIGAMVDTDKYSGILSVSGDGMLNQLLNGFASRGKSMSEADRAAMWSQMAFGIVPCGSANGFAACFGAVDVFEGVRCIVEMQQPAAPIDVVQMQYKSHDGQTQKEIWDLHMTSFAGLGDHDLLSEIQLRWMPVTFRNAYAPLHTILFLKTYQARVSLLPAPLSESDQDKEKHYRDCSILPEDPERPGWRVIQGPVTLLSAMNVPKAASDCSLSPNAEASDGAVDLCLTRAISKFQMLQLFLGTEKGTHVSLPFGEVYKVKAYHLQPDPTMGGNISVSGEVIPAGDLNATVHHGLARVMFPACYESQRAYLAK